MKNIFREILILSKYVRVDSKIMMKTCSNGAIVLPDKRGSRKNKGEPIGGKNKLVQRLFYFCLKITTTNFTFFAIGSFFLSQFLLNLHLN